MSLEKDLKTKLGNSASVTTVVSSTKIYQNMIPQGVSLPAISYFRVSDTPHHAMGSDPKLREARFQVSCWSTSPVQGKSAAEGVLSALRDFTGRLSGTTTSINVQRIFYDGMQSLMDIDPRKNTPVFHFSLDFLIWSTEG